MPPPRNTSQLDDARLLLHCPAFPSKTIRTGRRNIQIYCLGCGKSDKELGQPLRKCSGCHTAPYCSKKCQAENWPDHKPICREGCIMKLVKSLIANPLLGIQLQTCFILAFDLLHHPWHDKILLARLDVGVEPCAMADLSDIFLGDGSSSKQMQGMLQLNAFTPMTDPGSILDKWRTGWQRERAMADAAGFHDDAVVIMKIFHGDAELCISVPMQIAPDPHVKEVIAVWISGGFAIPSAATGQMTSVPCTVENCLQFINMHIRADNNNQLLLRTKMRPVDIRVIRNAAKDPNSVSGMLLHAKIAREHIYKSIRQEFVKRRTLKTSAFRR
ncbi:hypothetical protein C8R45DRAFT_1160095 [Mycena sanguinolenta]|nr:hypothetical protein C8R45DRAFT_1160095 [Mycena sanguinolenta]